MKMNRSYLIILAVGFALFSCAKPDMQDGVDSNRGVMDNSMDYITAAGPGAPVKTVVNNGTKVFWTDSDQIGLYAGEETAKYSTALAEPSATALFGRVSDVVPEKSNGKYYAVYPLSAISKWNLGTDGAGSDNTFCLVNLPQTQVAVKGSWDKSSAILVATSETNELAFKHAVAYLRFEISEQVKDLVSVRLASVNREPLSDPQAGLKFNASGKLEIVPGDEASRDVELKNSDPSATFESGAYYIALLPGEFAEGLTLTFTDAQDKVAEIAIDPLTLEAGQVADKGLLESLNFVKVVAPLKKATVYTDESGVKHGVVYWVDPSNPYKGKIISVSSEKMIWADKVWKTGTNNDKGLENYNKITGSDDYKNGTIDFKAIKYCAGLRETLGGEWYLPARGEWYDIYNAYYGLSLEYADFPTSGSKDFRLNADKSVNQQAMAQKRKFDEAFAIMGETTTAHLDGDADADGTCDNNGYGDVNGVGYWTSKVNSTGPVQHVTMGVYSLGNNQNALDKQQYVRCIRDIDITPDIQ